MSVASVNPYATNYQVAATNTKQPNTDSVENTQATATTRPGGDTVSISQEAQHKSRAEQYKLKDDPNLLFEEWLATDPEYAYITIPNEKDNDQLLPENQQLIERLTQKAMQETDAEKRQLMAINISNIRRWGDQELFNSEEDAINRFTAEATAWNMKGKYMMETYGENPIPEGLERHTGSLNQYPKLSDYVAKTQLKADSEPTTPQNLKQSITDRLAMHDYMQDHTELLKEHL